MPIQQFAYTYSYIYIVEMISKIKQQLLEKFDSLFERSSLERNTYLFNQMKSNLEIPFNVIFKERKILSITNDQKLIIDALKSCDKIKVNEDRKNIQLKLVGSKTKISIEKIIDEKACLEKVEKILKEELDSDLYKMEHNKTNRWIIINFTQQNHAKKIYNILENQAQLKANVYLDEANIYDQIKQAVQKSKKLKKQKILQNPLIQPLLPPQTNIPFDYNNLYNFTQQPWPSNFNNQMPFNFYDQRIRGPGFIRKAVESDQQQQQPQDKKPKYRIKEDNSNVSTNMQTTISNSGPKVQIQKRIRLNSQNFPSLDQTQKKIDEKILKFKYTKKEIVEVYNNIFGNVKIAKELQQSKIPLINEQGNFRLEAMKQGGRKSSTFESPKLTAFHHPFRKSSN